MGHTEQLKTILGWRLCETNRLYHTVREITDSTQHNRLRQKKQLNNHLGRVTDERQNAAETEKVLGKEGTRVRNRKALERLYYKVKKNKNNYKISFRMTSET